MIDIKWLRDEPEAVRDNCKNRQANVDIDALSDADKKYVALLKEVEDLRAERNAIAEASKDPARREEAVERGRKIKEQITAKEASLNEVQAIRDDLLIKVPNKTHPDAPIGKSDEDNVPVRQFGEPTVAAAGMDHVQIIEKYDLADFDRAARVTGAKFYYLKDKLAILDQAVLRYAMDFMMREGFRLLVTPDMAKEEVLVAKGFLPRGPEKNVYYIEGEDMALVGTSEITVLGYHMNEQLDADKLPIKYVAFSHCFRTEAGSYGRESYGMYRVHQFSKVEMFAFALPEQSAAIHAEFLSHEERFWQSLGIAHRVVDCVTGDLGGSDYRRYDIEAWMPGRNNGAGGWGEVTSCSNCLDYQARGLNTRYATKEGQKGLVHTLNGTVIATPRALIPILENNQQPDGSIKIPDVLVPYCGFDVIK